MPSTLLARTLLFPDLFDFDYFASPCESIPPACVHSRSAHPARNCLAVKFLPQSRCCVFPQPSPLTVSHYFIMYIYVYTYIFYYIYIFFHSSFLSRQRQSFPWEGKSRGLEPHQKPLRRPPLTILSLFLLLYLFLFLFLFFFILAKVIPRRDGAGAGAAGATGEWLQGLPVCAPRSRTFVTLTKSSGPS